MKIQLLIFDHTLLIISHISNHYTRVSSYQYYKLMLVNVNCHVNCY